MAVTIYSSGNIISSGIIMSGAIISGKNNFMEVTSGGSAFDTTVNSRGNVYVENGGYAAGTVVNSMGYLTLDHAVADSSVINSRGQLLLGSSATINHTLIDGGKVYMYDSSCTANHSIIRNGGTLSMEQGSAWNTVVKSDGILVLSNGAIAKNTTFASGGLGAIQENGIISDTVISGGALTISDGGSALNTTIYSGGHVFLEDNALINDLQVRTGGTLHILNGTGIASFNGTLTVAGKVIAENDVTGNFSIAWSIADTLPTESPMIEGMDHFATADFTITVRNNQMAGTYFLADGFSVPAGFTIKIGDGTSTHGSLSLNAPTLTVNNNTYTLTWQNNDALSLTVTGGQQTQNTNLLQNGISQIAAWDAKSGSVGYLATDGIHAPAWVEIAQWHEPESKIWSAVGTGHFKGTTAAQDGILLYNKAKSLFAVWQDLQDPDSGYRELYRANDHLSFCGLANLDGDEYDDILLRNNNGSFGILYGGVEWNNINGTQNSLQLINAGNFGSADGLDSLLFKNTADQSYSIWHNSDPATQNWTQTNLGTLDNDWSVAAVGDFLGDGVDDIIIWQKSTGNLYAWDNGASAEKRALGTLNQDHWEIAAVGDYNGDGQEDLLLRELVTGRGRLAYLASGDLEGWTDLHVDLATDTAKQFHILA